MSFYKILFKLSENIDVTSITKCRCFPPAPALVELPAADRVDALEGELADGRLRRDELAHEGPGQFSLGYL